MVKTLAKALRVQKGRKAAGKFGWSRAVRRFVAKHPSAMESLAKHVLEPDVPRELMRRRTERAAEAKFQTAIEAQMAQYLKVLS